MKIKTLIQLLEKLNPELSVMLEVSSVDGDWVEKLDLEESQIQVGDNLGEPYTMEEKEVLLITVQSV